MIFKDLPQNIKRGLYRNGEYGSPEARFQPQDEVPMALLERFNIRGQKAAESYRAEKFSELFVDEPGGLFEYNVNIKDSEGKPTRTFKMARMEPITEQDKQFVASVIERDFPGASAEGTEWSETVKDDPEKEFEYAFSKGLFGDMTREEAEGEFSAYPTRYREMMLGKDPSALGTAADITSAPGRLAMSVGEGPVEMARLTSDVKSEGLSTPLNMLAQMGGDLARDPWTIPSMAAGAGLSRIGAKGAFNLGNILKREAALGATEGLGSGITTEQRKLADLSSGDHAMNALMGAGMGALLPASTQGTKAGMKALRRKMSLDPTKESIFDKGLKLQEDLYTITPGLNPSGPRAAQWVGGSDNANYSPGMRKWYAEKLGVENPIKELFPTLGLKNRSSQMIRDIRDLSTREPKVFQRWQDTYGKLLGGIDKLTNYSNAPTLDEAGTLIQNSVKEAKDTFFNERETTYKKILENPETRAAVDAAMDTKEATKLKADLVEYQEILDARKSKKGVMEDITEEQMVPTRRMGFQSSKVEALEPQQVKVGERGVTVDNPEATPDVNAALDAQIRQVDGLINALDSRISGAWKPGQTLEGADLADEVNKLRANLQSNVQYRSVFDKDPIQDEVTKKLRNDLADFFMDATKKADPELANKLEINNKEISTFLNELGTLSKDLDAADKGVKGDDALAKSILNNNSKIKALRSLLTRPTEKSKSGLENKAMIPIVQSWFKHKVMKESAKTAEIKDSVRKQLKDNEAFVKEAFSPVVYEDLANFTEGLATIGDPQLIGIGTQMNRMGEKILEVPTTTTQAIKAMKEAVGLNSRNVSAQDKRTLKQIFDIQEGFDELEFGPREYNLSYPKLSGALRDLATGTFRTGARNLFTGDPVEDRRATSPAKQKENLFKRLQKK
jgi:hypothetical protein